MLKELVEAGSTIKQPKEAGYSESEFKKVGFALSRAMRREASRC